MAALDVAVVVDLDALRRRLEAERLRQPLEQLLLRRALGEAAAERLAGVHQRVLDELGLVAALRHGELDLAAGMGRERRFQERPSRRLVAPQDERGPRPV